MSELLHIGRLRARYRIRGDAARAGARLDLVLGRMLAAPLEAAVRRLDLPEGEEICVRALWVPVQLSLDGSDAAVAEAWSAVLARVLRQAIADGRDVIRFRSRHHALLDLVASAVRGDVSRGWAWAQLGLWDEPAQGSARTGEAIASALCALPEAAAAAVAEAARRGALPALAALVSPGGWRRVAAGALQAFEAGAPALAALERPPAGEGAPAPEADLTVRAARIAARSPILNRRELREVAPAALRPLLALAALAAEPEALRRQRPEAVLTALERLVRPAPPVRSEPDRERARRAGAPGPIADAARGASREAPGATSGGTVRAGSRAPGPLEPRPSAGADPTEPPAAVRPTARTRAGGLLFLLRLVSELELPEKLCGEGTALAGRSLRLGLHALGLALLPVEARDPAALAFCGLGPDEPPPGEGEEPLSDAERTALGSTAAELSEALRVRLGRVDEPARAVLHETCRRDAEIAFDPGWLEVRYALEGVDLRVRRAGLDLDPGWLPWLGCAVRFVYA